MDLTALHRIAEERSSDWARSGVRWDVIDGPLTDKPAAWLIFNKGDEIGQLTVWVSGEAEMDWGTPEHGGARHYDCDSPDALRACVRDLESALRVT